MTSEKFDINAFQEALGELTDAGPKEMTTVATGYPVQFVMSSARIMDKQGFPVP